MLSAHRRSFLYTAGLAAALLLPLAAAQAFSLVPAECQGNATISECGLAEFIGLFVRIAQYIFGISGSIALAIFVYGGFLWITSGGSADKVQQGKNAITGAVIGLVIIFGASTMIRFLVETVRSGGGGGAGGTALFQGESCTIGSDSGIQIQFEDGLRCVALNPNSCEGGDYELKPLGFSKIDTSTVNIADYECVNGMFPDEGRNIRCCRPLSTDVTAPPPPAATPATTPAATTPPATPAAAAASGGATGMCNCGPSLAGRAALAGASAADLAAAEAQCRAWGAAPNPADHTCNGTSTRDECTRRNDSSTFISCDWVAS